LTVADLLNMSIKSIDQSPFPIFKWGLKKKPRTNKNQPYKYTKIIIGKAKAEKFFKAANNAYGKPFRIIEMNDTGNQRYVFTLTLNKSIKEVELSKKKKHK